MDDSALTHQLKQGNQLAFTILYDTYSEQVYRLAFKYLCNKELAEDAVQNLFMKVWIKRTSLDESRPLNHFLFTVLKNEFTYYPSRSQESYLCFGRLFGVIGAYRRGQPRR